MHVKLISIGNSFGVRLPKSLIRQFALDKGDIELVVKDEGILIAPVSEVPPLQDWDMLFKKAKKAGFDAQEDAEDFSDWDTTSSDGL